MKHDEEGFECIDEHTQHMVKEQQLLQTLTSMAGEQQLLKKELQLKESFRSFLQQEKAQLADKVAKLEQHTDGLQQSLARTLETEKLSQEMLRGLSATLGGLGSLKDSLGSLVKSVSQKLDSLRAGDREIVEEIKQSHKDLKEEISGLYQQTIEQKNKQIKSLKSKLEEQKKQTELGEATAVILSKTASMEEQMRLIFETMERQAVKDREISELRGRLAQLEKVLATRESELQSLKEKQLTLERELCFKNEVIDSHSNELANKQLALISSESRLEQALSSLKVLQAQVRVEKQLREVVEQREYSNANLSAQVENSFRLIGEKIQLVEYQMSRNHELTELFELFEEKVTEAIRLNKENNLSFFFENIHDKLVLTLPEQKSILFAIKNDIKDVRDALLGEQPAAQRRYVEKNYEGHRKKNEPAYDFFDV